MGFSRRCEAIKAPTTENDPIRVARATIERTGGHEDLAQDAPVDEAEDQAGRGQRYAQSIQRPSQAAPRALIPPSPRPRSLALYSPKCVEVEFSEVRTGLRRVASCLGWWVGLAPI